MGKKIISFDKNNPQIGISVRKTTDGKELELVYEFIDYYCKYFQNRKDENHLAIFIEPKIESGFPDIVFAEYEPNMECYWNCYRNRLNENDYKILDQILYAKGCSGRYLCEKLGNSGAQVIESLEKLLDAKMIYRKNGVWRNYNLEKIYSIKKLISVEAKLGNIKKVREQTIANTWFASQSYALISTKNPRPKTIETFQKSGIGLYCKDYDFNKLVEAKKLSLPSSYLSWQFNDWIGKTVM